MNALPNTAPEPSFWQWLSDRSLHSSLCAALAIAVLTCGLTLVHAQTTAKTKSASSAKANKIAEITSLRIVQEKDGPAVEILSTKRVSPSIEAISDPPRLVIDLPNTRLDAPKRVNVQADQISALRASQFQQNPPVARVVVDLQAPRAYTWDAAGNRLVVHLGKNPTQPSNSPFQAPTVPSLTSAPPPPVASVRAAGPLSIAGIAGGTGSSITANSDTAILNLSSGGEVRICPGTTVSAVPSENHHNVMISMNTGALETHLSLDASSDSLLTPDFRIVLSGPGKFDYAISADSQGNTCIRALPGNTASAIVTELLGDRSYQVKPTDQLVFHSGQLDHVDMAVPLECGCPPPRDTPIRATSNLPVQSEVQNHTDSRTPPQVEVKVNSTAADETAHAQSVPSDAAPRTGVPVSGAEPANELHVQVEAPFVFRAELPPAPVEEARTLPMESHQSEQPALTAALSPAALPPLNESSKTETEPPLPRGFFKKIGAFFASLFH